MFPRFRTAHLTRWDNTSFVKLVAPEANTSQMPWIVSNNYAGARSWSQTLITEKGPCFIYD